MKCYLDVLCDPTKLRILNFLADKPSTITQLHERLYSINNRESVFKTLRTLLKGGLVTRELIGNKHTYSLGFYELRYGKLRLEVV